LLLLDRLLPAWHAGMAVDLRLLMALVLWQPLLEELLFRGVIQGQLARQVRFRLSVGGLSWANLATTVLFVLAHLFQHPPAWAVAVAIPSLVFGHFRDRYGQVYPAVILHAAYNACYLWMGGTLARGLSA
jgi:membrane protease YdiL (CAAX protease family)